ncbi:Uncharacterized protein cpbgf_2003050 [Cryptosporidium parvum]|nr:Uncharacterized protein CPATCC_0027740 [Cryptosporidium parvum]WKS76603.1 hypothetical protein CPCDC_2g3050 [Cryptosporidium sp. 43IA8]WRK31097.1 Uncharacterized protein cpbgf_2003050 [Cryptosporidium parvum]|eukprot:QOY42925.1 hypothetical protein CPATCC_000614 [Cryptosporidium parvum]
MLHFGFLLIFFLLPFIGRTADPDLKFKNLNESKKGLVKEEPPFATSVKMSENNETISDFSILNSSKFNNILSAETTCSRKLQNKDKYPNCCSSIVSIFETERICNQKPQIDKSLNESNGEIARELSEIKQYYDYHCNNTEYQLLVSKNITSDDVYNCMRYNELTTRSTNSTLQELDGIKLKDSESIVDNQRALQITGWMNSFGLPAISSTTMLSQSRFTEGSFMHSSGGQNCSPLLTLIFVRVCNSICNANNDSSSGRASIPIFCLRDCQPFAKFACLRGCRTFGCHVDIYTCMELMCQ